MDWISADKFVEYEEALSFMEERVSKIHKGETSECVWLLEHPPLYTAGTSAKEADLIKALFPVYQTGRGGEYTYHGPGQRVAYVILNLKQRQSEPDIKKYVWQLEEWIILTLAELGLKGERRQGRVGIWVVQADGSEAKIAAIGVRIRHWITFHGISINVHPDLSHFSGIVPCGIAEHGVTSIHQELGKLVSMKEVDQILQHVWGQVF